MGMMALTKSSIVFSVAAILSTIILALILFLYDQDDRHDRKGIKELSVLTKYKAVRIINMTEVAFAEVKEIAEKGTLYGVPVNKERPTYKPMCTIVLPQPDVFQHTRRLLYNPVVADDVMTHLSQQLASENGFSWNEKVDETTRCDEQSKKCAASTGHVNDEFINQIMEDTTPRYTQTNRRFVDFTNYTETHSVPAAVYIALVPHPVDWFIDMYERRRDINKEIMALDDCLRRFNGSGCIAQVDTILSIMHLCGDDYTCRLLRSYYDGFSTPIDQSVSFNRVASVSMNHAVWTASHSYNVVATTDDLEQFFFVLEKLIPQFFSGIIQQSAQLKDQKSTVHRTISKESRAKLETILVHEMQLYYFIKERFGRLYQCVKKQA